MPRIQRHALPPTLFQHLLDRIHSREIPAAKLGWRADWLATDPEAPAGSWYKSFPRLIVCGEGRLIKTFLNPGQLPHGKEVR